MESPPEPVRSVVMVTGSLEAGGAERVLADMANYWNSKGWRITLATWAGPSSEDFYELDSGVQRVWLDVESPSPSLLGKFLGYIRRIRKFRRMLANARPDAVLSFIDTSNVMTLLACMGLALRVVVSERVNGAANASIPWVWRASRIVTYWRANAVVAQTPDAARWIKRLCGVEAVAIRNPLRALPEADGPRESKILAVGRLTRQKGFDLLIQAFAGVAQEFSNWRLVIIGAGPEHSALLSLTEQLKLGDRVEFRPPVKDIELWMSRAGLVVQPSRFEGFPNVILEAMGMGAAVISADCPSGPAEIIVDGVNGRLVPVDDVAMLTRVMSELLHRPEERLRLGREAKKVRQAFRQDLVMKQWENCVTPALSRGRPVTGAG
jgi:GalNAc-alpha-(1->4)-GalNAc-alpha-(1->3)-diNAcBac-PP-undecaprenol alpha-1,4-N-acetyl-D-galactosaminyltransferase